MQWWAHPEYSWRFIGRTDAEAPILWPPDAKSWLIGRDPDAEKDCEQEEKGMTEDEMVGWHHWLDGHEFKQTPEDNEEQGSLACCSPWGHKTVRYSWATEQQNDDQRELLSEILTWRWFKWLRVKLNFPITLKIFIEINKPYHWKKKNKIPPIIYVFYSK